MQIRVLYFGVVRERVARRSDEHFSLPDGAKLHDLIDRLGTTYPPLAAATAHIRLAVNEEIAQPDHLLRDGDVVALIPPVAGGSDSYVRITEDTLSVDQALQAVTGPDQGGVVTFIGYVRGQSDGKAVDRLEYEAYKPMAERSLRDIIDRCERVGTGVRVAVSHRVGILNVGEMVVVIAAAAPHRAEAFQAARMCAELMKEETTIWKKEIGSEGEEWVGGPADLQLG